METKSRAGLRVGGTMGVAAAGMVVLEYLGLPEMVAMAVVVLAGAGIRAGAQALGVAGLAGIVLLTSGCAVGAGGLAFGQSATCSGVYSERYTEEGWLSEASCDGEYVAGGSLSDNAISAGEGVGNAARVVLPPLVTGGGGG